MNMRAILAVSLSLGLVISGPSLAKSARTVHKAAAHKTTSQKVSTKTSKRKTVRRPDPGFVARDAYYSGDFQKAYPLAVQSGEKWVAALSAYRLSDYSNAYSLFKGVAEDMSGDAWLRSGAAFWASRAAVAAGLPEEE